MSEEREEWYKVNDDTEALVVPSGWLYRVRTQVEAFHNDSALNGVTHVVSVVFVPEPRP